MQSCVTKFFKPLDPALQDQYFDWLFEKEEADRKKREEERLAKIKAVCTTDCSNIPCDHLLGESSPKANSKGN